jgi:adenine phosphoribosyltransferase
MQIKSLVRTIPHHPKPGVMFRDITTLLRDAAGYHATIETLAARYRNQRIAKVAGIEARGFIVAAPLAFTLGAGFVPLRKRGRLPAATVGHDYALEYGTDRIEMHVDAISPGERVLVADDLIATGGTAAAAVKLIEGAGGEVAECCFVIELPELGGRRRIEALGHPLFALCEFEGE